MKNKRTIQVIGLTGGIACGKTTVAEELRRRGYIVLDADAVSRALTRPGGEGLPPIREAFGDAVFSPDGALDRRALAALIFGDARKRQALNAILHPLIMAVLAKQRERALARGPLPIFEDIPLLYEIGGEKNVDAVWVVYCDEKTQLSRLMARDHCAEEEALSRVRSQMPAAEKARRADAVIDTTEGWEAAKLQLERALARLEG